MRDYIAIFTTKTRAAIVVRFHTFSEQLAQAAAQRYARDFVLHLETVIAA